MSGAAPGVFRILFPLTPMFAVLSLYLIDARLPAKPYAVTPVQTVPSSQIAVAQLSPAISVNIPPRVVAPPKYQVKLVSVQRSLLDYDIGSYVVTVACAFEDLCAEWPVVGISEMGSIVRVHTDSGALIEGTPAFSTISPNIFDFRNAPFAVTTKVPRASKTIRVLNGAVTVLRGRNRAALVWQGPLTAAIGTTRKAAGFEFTLTKFDVASDMASVEWTYKMPPDTGNSATPFSMRQVKTALYCSDKTALNPDTSKEKTTKEKAGRIRCSYRLNKKTPMTLELSFLSELKLENAAFELSGISLDGRGARIQLPEEDQNF